MPKSLTQTLDDPEFRKLQPDTQKAVLKKLGVSDDMQGKLLAKIAAPPTQPQPGFMSRVSSRVSGQASGASHLIGQGLKDLFEGNAFSKEVTHPEYAGVTGALTAGPRAAAQQVSGLAKDWIKDPANLAGDVLTGEMLGAGETPKVPEMVERAPKSASKAEIAAASVPEHLRHLTKDQRAKYQEKVTAANEAHQQKLAEHAAKQEAEKQVNVATRDAQNNIMSTHRVVRGALDDRWENLRSEMKGTPVSNPADIYNGVRAAEQEHLRGAPQSLQQFRNLVKELGIEDFVENEDGTLSAADTSTGKPLDWETARVHYSAIGERLAGGGLPGNVYQALKSVSSLLDSKLKDTAAASGREQEYTALKSDWSDYLNDWKNIKAVSKGGSPLAHMMQTPDAGYARVHMIGPAADRLLQTLEKYRSQGAQPELVGKVRNLHAESRLPRPKRVPVPKPGPKPVSPLTRGLVHAAGVAGGGSLGSAMGGHWMIGIGAGRTLSEAAIRALEKKRAREAEAVTVP